LTLVVCANATVATRAMLDRETSASILILENVFISSVTPTFTVFI
jgi:hypothetical protein